MQLHAFGLYFVLQYLSIIEYGRHCPDTSLPTKIDCNILRCDVHHNRFVSQYDILLLSDKNDKVGTPNTFWNLQRRKSTFEEIYKLVYTV